MMNSSVCDKDRASMSDYTLRFRNLVAVSGWNETGLLIAYRRGLNLDIRQQMAIYDDVIGLESFIQQSIHISQHLTACMLDTTILQPPAKTSVSMGTNANRHFISIFPVRSISNVYKIGCGAHVLPNCPE